MLKDLVINFCNYETLSRSQIPGRIKNTLNGIKATVSHDIPPRPRLPIWLQLFVATMFVLTITVSILSYVIMERQKEKIYDHTVKLGTLSLNYICNNAKIPLLTNDTLALNTLVNNIASVKGHTYAFIVDNNGLIKAHTNPEKIGKPMASFPHTGQPQQLDSTTILKYTQPNGSQVLDLGMPITFQDKKLGYVHIGLSIDFIKTLYIDERAFLASATLIIIFLAMIVAVLVSLRFSKPLSQLVEATAQIARGNYDFTMEMKRNDEFGTLGSAFNTMKDELFRQSIVKESFGKYVGPEVVDMILKNPDTTWLKGQKRTASILFADIRGFTAYAENKVPEELVEELNGFFSIATEVVHRHGGYVDKFIGDSVLAVFGVPVCQENHLEQCIKAAIDMQHQLSEHAENGNALLSSIGIGIASGVVLAGNIGSQFKMEYTVIGDSVNVASYLNTLAGAGEIIIGCDSETTFGNFIDMEPMKPQKIKKRENLVKVYKVAGLKN